MAIFSSLVTFTLMATIVVYDEFRLVWFFLISFASFILLGKRYGLLITAIIIVIVWSLYSMVDMKLSLYTILTFMTALFVFNLFSFYFLQKIEHDSLTLQARVKEEVEKQQLQEQMLLQKYRMANMGEMIDAIAHQWRQPLMQSNMILLNMDDGLDDEVDKSYLKEKIVELTQLNRHMSQTIDDFRGLLSDGKKRETFEMADVVDEVLRVMKNSLREVNVRYEEGQTFSVLGYKNELMQVVITLLSNALEALEEIENPTIVIELNTKERTLSVEDNAGGVEPKIIEKIFDPYFTTKEQSGGTGLGLYVSKIIVEQNMQGKLLVTNEKEGAKFSIVFGEGK
jgi:C4-dicarboxylate-specific signal transduction histidine kinase